MEEIIFEHINLISSNYDAAMTLLYFNHIAQSH